MCVNGHKDLVYATLFHLLFHVMHFMFFAFLAVYMSDRGGIHLSAPKAVGLEPCGKCNSFVIAVWPVVFRRVPWGLVGRRFLLPRSLRLGEERRRST